MKINFQDGNRLETLTSIFNQNFNPIDNVYMNCTVPIILTIKFLSDRIAHVIMVCRFENFYFAFCFDNDNFGILLFIRNLNGLISIYVYVYARPLMLKGILKQFSLNELASRKLF